MARTILRKPAVTERTGLSAAQIWRLEKAGRFPARVQISAGAVGWFSDEIDAWVEARVRGFGRGPTPTAAPRRRKDSEHNQAPATPVASDP